MFIETLNNAQFAAFPQKESAKKTAFRNALLSTVVKDPQVLQGVLVAIESANDAYKPRVTTSFVDTDNKRYFLTRNNKSGTYAWVKGEEMRQLGQNKQA